ncbi:MAG: alpha/beta hydrolase fold domain-containing protein [Solirubrobacteraceae bacterium]|jgi:hypothetical protein
MNVSTPIRSSASTDFGPAAGLVAELRLRFAAKRLRGRVYWSHATSPEAPAPLLLWLRDPHAIIAAENADVLGRLLVSNAHVVVVAVWVPRSTGPSSGCGYEMAALEWAAEHAQELDADPRQLLLTGQDVAGAQAAWVAIRAADRGWPELHRQFLVHPTFTDRYPIPSRPVRVAPATIITTGALSDDGRRYARQLRSAGVEVAELLDTDVTPTFEPRSNRHGGAEQASTMALPTAGGPPPSRSQGHSDRESDTR